MNSYSETNCPIFLIQGSNFSIESTSPLSQYQTNDQNQKRRYSDHADDRTENEYNDGLNEDLTLPRIHFHTSRSAFQLSRLFLHLVAKAVIAGIRFPVVMILITNSIRYAVGKGLAHQAIHRKKMLTIKALIPCRVFHNSRLTQDLKTNKTFLLSCTVPAEFYLTGHHRRIYLIREGSCRDCGHSVHRLVRQALSPVRQVAPLSIIGNFPLLPSYQP